MMTSQPSKEQFNRGKLDIQALAFDLDGTLVDSLPGLASSIQLMLKDLSLPTVSDAQVKVWIGNGVDVLIERTLTAVNASRDLQATAKAHFERHYHTHMDSGTVLFPHVLDTLEALKQKGYPMALVTNKPAHFLPALLTSLKIEKYFSLCIGGGDMSKMKPHPAPLFQVMATFGIYSHELLFVGDSRNDIQAAKSAHSITAGLTFGYNYGESIALSKPDFVFDRFDDILSLVD